MNIKRFWKMALAQALTLALLTGCGKSVYSSQAASAVNSAQNIVNFSTDTALDNALRKAVQAGGDLTAVRNALLEELGYRDAAYFSVSGIRSVRTGQHAVQVYRVSGSVSAAAESIAEEIAGVLNALRSGGEYTGHISMVKDNGSCYIAVDLTIVKQAAGSSSGSSGSDEGSGDEELPEPKPEPEPEPEPPVTVFYSGQDEVTQYTTQISAGVLVGDLFPILNEGISDVFQQRPYNKLIESGQGYAYAKSGVSQLAIVLNELYAENQLVPNLSNKEALAEAIHQKMIEKNYLAESVKLVADSSQLVETVKREYNGTGTYYSYLIATAKVSKTTENTDKEAATQLNKNLTEQLEKIIPQGEGKFFIASSKISGKSNALCRITNASSEGQMGMIRINDDDEYCYVAVLRVHCGGTLIHDDDDDGYTKEEREEIRNKLLNQLSE